MSDHLGPITETAPKAPMDASKHLLASPATPEQAHISKSRTHDGAEYTPDGPLTDSTLRTTPATADTTRNWSESASIHMLDLEYSHSSLASTQQEGGLAGLAEDATATTPDQLKTAALEEEISNLRQELARQTSLYTQTLDAEHAWCQATVQRASDVACSIRDAHIQLAAESDQLRARVAQLELEAAEESAYINTMNEQEQQGNEQLIAALQVEIGDLERQLHKAHRARIAAAETEEAALLKAEILQQQVEQMVELLEKERMEKEKLVVALKAASVLPSVDAA